MTRWTEQQFDEYMAKRHGPAPEVPHEQPKLKREKRMGKRQPGTPRSRVRAALRQLWLRSRERQTAIKRDEYTCQRCKRKQSKAKGKEFFVEVHHKRGIGNWNAVIDSIYREILCDPIHLETLCPSCHINEVGKVDPGAR